MKEAARKTTAIFLAFGLAACGQVESTKPVASDTYDPELGVDTAALTPINGTCSFVSTTGVMTVALANTDIALFARRSDGAVTINDAVCTPSAVIYANATDVTAAHAGSGTLLKKIVIATAVATGTDEHVIIDFVNGAFALGSGNTITTNGMTIDLKDSLDGGDFVSFRGTNSTTVVDSIVSGMTGINYTAAAVTANVAAAPDTTLDISVANIDGERFVLLDGADLFNGGGSTQTGSALTSNINATVFGGPGNDIIRGGDGNDTLSGGDGNDVFWMSPASDGNDEYHGGAGIDTVSYGGAPVVSLATNIPTGNGTSGMRTHDVVAVIDNSMASSGEGSEGDQISTDVEVVMGGSGDDNLWGNSGNETIYGGAGNDTIRGRGGADLMFGEAGNDTFNMDDTLANANAASPTGSDILNGGTGVDVADFSMRVASVFVTNDGVAADDGEATEIANVKADVETVLGGIAADILSAGTNTVAVTLSGAAGADTITGGSGNDVLNGGDDDDTVSGGAGDDTFIENAPSGGGPTGNDSYTGGAGKDTVDYSQRNSTIWIHNDGMSVNGDVAESENDIIMTDVERFIGGIAADNFQTGSEDDELVGGQGDDTLWSGDGNDVVEGNSGTDDIDCGAGDGDICIDGVDCATAISCEL